MKPTEIENKMTELSRRGFVKTGLAATGTLCLGGVESLLRAVPASAISHRPALLGFKGIAPSNADTVVVPEGYSAQVLIAWGDPVSDGPAFRQDAGNTSAEQALQWGMHNDGLAYFPMHGSERGLLAQNHEYTDDALLFPDGTANWTAEKTKKALAAHGVSIIEIERGRRRRLESCATFEVRAAHHGLQPDENQRTSGRRQEN